ncbi:MAG TPA: response regulator transcription factor [Bacteroidetes bacterium]|nr:response regulator transcription factor [Bacteroidota bacterium]
MLEEIRTIIVEDDPMTRKIIADFVNRTDSLKLTAQFSNAVEAANWLQKSHTDLLLLDIEMPDMNGFELLKVMETAPSVIVLSGKDRYAVHAFDMAVDDFIVKPVRYPRFLQAVQRIQHSRAAVTQLAEKPKPSRLFVKVGSEYLGVPFESIFLVESQDDYVKIHTESRRYTIYSTLKGILAKLPPAEFIRIHRSYIVRLPEIEGIEENTVKVRQHVLPVGGTFRANLLKALALE